MQLNPLVHINEAKAFMHVDHSDEDALISLLIQAASDAVRDVTGWMGDYDSPEEQPPDRIKLAVLTRVQIAYDNRDSVDPAKGETILLTPLRTLET